MTHTSALDLYTSLTINDDDVHAAVGIMQLCGEHMHRTQKHDHWYPTYDVPTFRGQLVAAAASLHVVTLDWKYLVATFTLSQQPRAYYTPGIWHNPDAKAAYLGRLAVLPVMQGRGIGKQVMRQIEQCVRAGGYGALRFDALTENTTLLSFYETLGYTRLRDVHKPYSVTCFEKTFEPLSSGFAFPCPACGFLTFAEGTGSYDICPICNWEDDGVQLNMPDLPGGANKYSLADAQARVIKKLPTHIQTHGIYDRDPQWYPLTQEDAYEMAQHHRKLLDAGDLTHLQQRYYWRDDV